MLQPILRDVSTSTAYIDQLRDDWISERGQNFNLIILILNSVNVFAAFLTIGSIFYNAWSTKEWDFYPKTRRFFTFVPIVHPADVFPIIFLAAVMIQGAILIGISVGTSRSTLHGCSKIAQVVWPVLWIAPYTTLMFGLETALRSLQKTKSGMQGRWHIMTCVGGALILTLLTWIPSNASPSNGQCLTSVIWWTGHYARAGFAIASTLVIAYIICALVITFQLLKTANMDRDQRIQASTVVYYLIVTALIISMVIPYYTQEIMHGRAIRMSKLAEVALGTTGIIPAILRILLHSNDDWTMIQACENYCFKNRKLIVETTDLNMYDHMTSPVSLHTCNSQTLLNDPEKLPIKSPEHSNGLRPPSIDNALTGPSIQVQSTQSARANYSIFPTNASEMARESVSTTFSQGDDDIELPQPSFAYSHKRDLSDQSSATVQIGLRLSNLPNNHNLVESPAGTSMPRFPTSISSPYSSSQGAKNNAQLSGSPNSPLNDIAILPIHLNQPRMQSQSMSPRRELLSPTWFLRHNPHLNSERQGREKDTMKSLPPTPPRDAASSPSVRRSPELSRLASRHDIPTADKWL